MHSLIEMFSNFFLKYIATKKSNASVLALLVMKSQI